MAKTDAPGLRRRQGGKAFYWVAAAVSRQAAEYPVKTVRLHYATDDARAARCRELTGELQEWLSRRTAPAFDDTISGLVRVYQTEPTSPYHKLRENTRRNYDYDMRVLCRTVGRRVVGALTGADFARWHERFAEPAAHGGPRRIRRAHGLMTMLRLLFGFGTTMRFRGCAEAVAILDKMRFEIPRPRRVTMKFDQAEAIVLKALATKRRSIALGQALQFELALRQVDVIGYWIKATPDAAGIVDRGRQWTGGLTWSDWGEIVTKETTKTGTEGKWNPSLAPLVVRAVAAYAPEERVGPMILDESTGKPYLPGRYPRVWRKIATAAGVPSTVWNRDSRSGALTESDDAGADAKDMQRLATHADYQTTTRYIRGGLEATERVARLRQAYRERQKNKA